MVDKFNSVRNELIHMASPAAVLWELLGIGIVRISENGIYGPFTFAHIAQVFTSNVHFLAF